MAMVLYRDLVPLVTVPMLGMLVSAILAMLDMLLLPQFPMVMLVLDMDMLDTMASVRLRLTLMLTLSDRLLMDFLLPMPTLPATLTMSELSQVPLTLPPPIPDMLDMLAMLDILAMLVLDTQVLAILVLTMVKLGNNYNAEDLVFLM